MRPIDGDKLYADLKDAGMVFALRMVAAAPTITPLPNNPLTPEELREMGGEPYWHIGLQDDSKPPHWAILDPYYAKHIEAYGYGKRWLAYRRKPKEGTA